MIATGAKKRTKKEKSDSDVGRWIAVKNSMRTPTALQDRGCAARAKLTD